MSRHDIDVRLERRAVAVAPDTVPARRSRGRACDTRNPTLQDIENGLRLSELHSAAAYTDVETRPPHSSPIHFSKTSPVAVAVARLSDAEMGSVYVGWAPPETRPKIHIVAAASPLHGVSASRPRRRRDSAAAARSRSREHFCFFLRWRHPFKGRRKQGRDPISTARAPFLLILAALECSQRPLEGHSNARTVFRCPLGGAQLFK